MESLREKGLLDLIREGSWGILSVCINTWLRDDGDKEDGGRFALVVSWERTRGKIWNMNLKREYLEETFCCGGDWTQEQVAKRSCVVTILGLVQNLTGHSPEWPAVAGCALSRDGWDRWSSQISSNLRGSVNFTINFRTYNIILLIVSDIHHATKARSTSYSYGFQWAVNTDRHSLGL